MADFKFLKSELEPVDLKEEYLEEEDSFMIKPKSEIGKGTALFKNNKMQLFVLLTW